jgi:hypothetical protein
VGPPSHSTTPVDLRESVSGILHPSTNWHQDGRKLSVLVLDKVARSDLERSDHARTSFWLLCSVFKERRAETHVSRETEVSDRMTGGSEGPIRRTRGVKQSPSRAACQATQDQLTCQPAVRPPCAKAKNSQVARLIPAAGDHSGRRAGKGAPRVPAWPGRAAERPDEDRLLNRTPCTGQRPDTWGSPGTK